MTNDGNRRGLIDSRDAAEGAGPKQNDGVRRSPRHGRAAPAHTVPIEKENAGGVPTEAAAVEDAIARADLNPNYYRDVVPSLDWKLREELRRALLRLRHAGWSEGETGHIRAELNRRVALLADLSGLLYAAEQGDRVAVGVLCARLDG